MIDAGTLAAAATTRWSTAFAILRGEAKIAPRAGEPRPEGTTTAGSAAPAGWIALEAIGSHGPAAADCQGWQNLVGSVLAGKTLSPQVGLFYWPPGLERSAVLAIWEGAPTASSGRRLARDPGRGLTTPRSLPANRGGSSQLPLAVLISALACRGSDDRPGRLGRGRSPLPLGCFRERSLPP